MAVAALAEDPRPMASKRDRLFSWGDANQFGRFKKPPLIANRFAIHAGTACSRLSAFAPQKMHGPGNGIS
jgi:hypothetical protein